MVSVFQLEDEHRIVEAAKVLAEACADDTLARYLLPGGERHKAYHFFEYLVRVHLRHGEVWVAEQEGRLTAVIVVETKPITEEQQAANGIMDAMSHLGPEPAEKLFSFFVAVEEYRAQHYANPHHHGILVGALPDINSLGSGLRLVEAAMESARKDGQNFYGEVLNDSNMKLYSALGFESVGEFDAGGLHVIAVVKRVGASAS